MSVHPVTWCCHNLYPEFLRKLLHWLLHSSKLSIHPLSNLFKRISHLQTETRKTQISSKQKPTLPCMDDVMAKEWLAWRLSLSSPPWCISSHPVGDWLSTRVPAPPVYLSLSSALHHTLWAHDAAARSLAPHWSCLRGAEGDRIVPVRFL